MRHFVFAVSIILLTGFLSAAAEEAQQGDISLKNENKTLEKEEKEQEGVSILARQRVGFSYKSVKKTFKGVAEKNREHYENLISLVQDMHKRKLEVPLIIVLLVSLAVMIFGLKKIRSLEREHG